MHNESPHKDAISEYAETAKKIHASQSFRADTLRKIRIASAKQPEIPIQSHPIDDDFFAADFSSDSNTQAITSKQLSTAKSASPKVRLHSFLVTAAAFAMVVGVGLFLYNRAKQEQAQVHSPRTANSSSSAFSDRSSAEIHSISQHNQELLAQYRAANQHLSILVSQAQEVFQRMTVKMNPPTAATSHSYSTDVAQLQVLQKDSENDKKLKESIVNELLSSDDVILYDACNTSGDTLTVWLANGTDSTISLSRGCSLVQESSNHSIGGGALSISKDTTKVSPHSTAQLEIRNLGTSMMLGQDYCFTLFNCGFRLDSSDGGARQISFPALDFGQNIPEKVLDVLSDGNDHLITHDVGRHPDYQEVEQYHDARSYDDLIGCYQPAFTYVSDIWTFSPQLNDKSPLDGGVRDVWYLSDDGTYFAERLNNSEYHIYHLNIENGSITELFTD